MVLNGRKGKEIGRLAKGLSDLSLIAKEFAKRSPTLQSAKNGDFEALLKNAVVSATDLSGLTKGTLSQFTDNPPHSATTTDNNADSVVYFTHDESPLLPTPPEPEQPPQEEQPPATNAASSTSTVEVEPLDSRGQQQFEQQPQPPPPPLPRRKPRERDKFLPPHSPEHSGLLVLELGLPGEPFRSLPRDLFMVLRKTHQATNLRFLHFYLHRMQNVWLLHYVECAELLSNWDRC